MTPRGRPGDSTPTSAGSASRRPSSPCGTRPRGERRLQPARARRGTRLAPGAGRCARCAATCCRPACRSASATWSRCSSRHAGARRTARRGRSRHVSIPTLEASVPHLAACVRSPATSTTRSTRSRARTTTASCAPSAAVILAALAHQPLPARRRTARPKGYLSFKLDPKHCPSCRSRGRCSRSGCTRRASRACTCAWARSRAADCAGRTAARTSAPRSSG